jgi:hypothetical protein
VTEGQGRVTAIRSREAPPVHVQETINLVNKIFLVHENRAG